VVSVKTDADMKKNIKKAQMGGAYASRRAYKSAGATKPSTGTTKSSSPQSSSKSNNISNVNRNDGYADYMKTVDSKPVDTVKSTPAKVEGNKGGASTRQRAAVTTSKANTPAPSTSSSTGFRAKVPIRTSTLDIPKRETVDVTYKPKARNYSDTEKKVLALTDKGGVGGKNLTEGERMKLKSLQAKRASEKMKAERKDNRVGNKSNRATNKTISRISKVNKKPKK
jgi:hypothetical protein